MKLTKKKRLEKAKIKLKAKKLPKGQNVTDTSFKVRKIVLPSQLKDPKPGDIVTKKQHNIPVLISHLDHHRPQMRHIGLYGLKEVILSYDSSELSLYLPKIFEAITSMILDLDSGIRKSAMDILQIIFAKIPKEVLSPHFKSMQVYMTAAMTHINPFLQRDSLRMLDIMLSEAPELMKKSVNTFLPTFLDLVSNAKNNSTSERTLFDVFNRKVSNVKWRDMVLSRLTKYFSLLITQKQDEAVTSYSGVASQVKPKTSAVIHWNGDTPLYVAEQLMFIQRVCYLANIFASHSFSFDSTTSDEEFLMKHIDNVMPVLLESWIEVTPKDKDLKIEMRGNLIGHQAAVTLQFILETIVSVWKCLEDMEECTGKVNSLTDWFKKKYKKKIIRKFISNFPYENDDVFARGPNEEYPHAEKMLLLNPVPVSSKCNEQNLLICYLVECLDCTSDTNITDSVVKCLENCIKNWENNKSLPTLLMALKTILQSDHRGWPKSEILRTIMEGLNIKALTNDLRLTLLQFFGDYIHNAVSPGTTSGEELDSYLSNLPLLLLQPQISMKEILALRRLSSQNGELFMATLHKKSRSICENLFNVRITGVDSQLEGQKAIIDILFYTGDQFLYKFLRKLAVASRSDEDLIRYIDSMEEFYFYLSKSVDLGENEG